jgi:hypothetical protein
MPLNSNKYAIPGGELIETHGRDVECLPHWYRVASHPLVPDTDNREIWVRFQDLSSAESQSTYEWSKNVPDPYGPDEDMPAKGKFRQSPFT